MSLHIQSHFISSGYTGLQKYTDEGAIDSVNGSSSFILCYQNWEYAHVHMWHVTFVHKPEALFAVECLLVHDVSWKVYWPWQIDLISNKVASQDSNLAFPYFHIYTAYVAIYTEPLTLGVVYIFNRPWFLLPAVDSDSLRLIRCTLDRLLQHMWSAFEGASVNASSCRISECSPVISSLEACLCV